MTTDNDWQNPGGVLISPITGLPLLDSSVDSFFRLFLEFDTFIVGSLRKYPHLDTEWETVRRKIAAPLRGVASLSVKRGLNGINDECNSIVG